MDTGVWGGGQMPLTFCHDGAPDFFKIDGKIIGGGEVVANLQISRGRGQKFSLMPPFL